MQDAASHLAKFTTFARTAEKNADGGKMLRCRTA